MTDAALAKIGPRPIVLRDLGEVERFATLIYKSTLVPKDYRNNLADVIGVITFGLDLGLNPMQALQNVAWINGKPSVFGDMLLGLVEASGLLEQFAEVEPDEALRAGMGRCSVKRRGRDSITRTFTRENAETAHLWGKDIWKAYPGRMLQMRARSWALRDAFSDILKGLIAREEAQDISDVTPAPLSMTPVYPGDKPAPEHPTMDQIACLFDMVYTCGGDFDAFGARLRRLMVFGDEQKITKRFLVETMTLDHFGQIWDHYQALLKAQVEAAVNESVPGDPDADNAHEGIEQVEEDSPYTPADVDVPDNYLPSTMMAVVDADGSQGQPDAVKKISAVDKSELQAEVVNAVKAHDVASVTELATLKQLAARVGDDAIAEVAAMITNHGLQLRREVFEAVTTKLRGREAVKIKAERDKVLDLRERI